MRPWLGPLATGSAARPSSSGSSPPSSRSGPSRRGGSTARRQREAPTQPRPRERSLRAALPHRPRAARWREAEAISAMAATHRRVYILLWPNGSFGLLRLCWVRSGAALGPLSRRRSRRSRPNGSARRHASRGLPHAAPRSWPSLSPFLGGRAWRPSAHRCARGHAFLYLFGARRVGRVLLLDGRVRRDRTAGCRA